MFHKLCWEKINMIFSGLLPLTWKHFEENWQIFSSWVPTSKELWEHKVYTGSMLNKSRLTSSSEWGNTRVWETMVWLVCVSYYFSCAKTLLMFLIPNWFFFLKQLTVEEEKKKRKGAICCVTLNLISLREMVREHFYLLVRTLRITSRQRRLEMERHRNSIKGPSSPTAVMEE